MAEKKKAKRTNKRKSRTAVPSDSESENDHARTNAKQLPDENSDTEITSDKVDREEGKEEEEEEEEQSTSTPANKKNPQTVFEDFYLRQITKEFANDLDKLRTASDFNEGSVAVLIEGLKQGAACFSPEERRRVGNAAGLAK